MKRHFLIVDDSLVARMLLKNILQSTGATISESSDGESALDRLEQGDVIDAIFLDITMPGIDGIETLARIKSRHADIPVVMVTADVQARTIQRAMDAGAFDVIRKKINQASIHDVLNRLFGPKDGP